MKIESQLAFAQSASLNHRFSSAHPTAIQNSQADVSPTVADEDSASVPSEIGAQQSVTDPSASADQEKLSQRRREARQELEIQEQIRELSARDREVRNHEQAHVAAGGQYAGSPVYQFKRGPDGISYAVGGEVSISVSREGSPEATIRKAEIIKRAALAPAGPSPQDRRVAALASQMAAQARAELVAQQRSEEQQKVSEADAEQEPAQANKESKSTAATTGSAAGGRPANESDSVQQISYPHNSSISSYLSISSSSSNASSILSAIA